VAADHLVRNLRHHRNQGAEILARGPRGQAVAPGLEQAPVGQQAGSRVLAMIPPGDGFGSAGNPTEGVGPDDSLVFADILAAS
jgi:FKBP-type peptidyl-prolyl cis-trans isomerase